MVVIVTMPKGKPSPSAQRDDENYFDYSPRGIWLRAVVIGGHESISSMTFSMIMWSGMFLQNNTKSTLLRNFIVLISGTLTLAIAQFVSVYTQADIMTFQAKRDAKMSKNIGKKRMVPSPMQVASVASLTYFVGSTIILLGAGLIRDHKVRSIVAMIMASLSMIVVGVISAVTGRAPVGRSCARVLIGGWLTMFIMWGRNEILRYVGLEF